jgi:hypothetical protein
MVTPVSGMDLLLKPETPDSIEVPGATSYSNAGNDDMSVEDWVDEISDMSDLDCLNLWHSQKEFIFSHRDEPIPLFSTGVVEESGYEYNVVKKHSFGNSGRPVLKRGSRFTKLGHQIGKVISLQYIVDSEQKIAQAVQQVPYDVSDQDIDVIERFFESHDAAWVLTANGPELAVRFPISPSTPYSGMIYFMYSLNVTGQEIPRYIGMSRKLGRDNSSLGTNFAQITRDSVFGRWGYGSSQHLGELSKVIFSDYYDGEKNKYQDWADALFIDRSRVLKSPVYIEMVPFFDQSIADAEEKLIRLASRLFDQFLLNKEYTSP